ncbi:hypothetical protein [Acetobacter cibinongensis]|uniref:Uncharacterized protein n=1 Tax=Acetobacter cibinongensis TaxID=146475 RepID=A0A1Z5YTC4_9PROT|nr:hypothetical protein [Acetobacter cibinongensis]OUJ01539.1 hypothetical protein HK14_08875 [Acetobacter cibinongensis]
MKLASLLPSLFGLLGNVGSAALGDKMAAYNTAAQTAVKAAVTKVDDGVDHLQTAFKSWETSNPVAQEAIDGTIGLLRDLGIAVPKQDVVVTHVKAAIADLAGIFVPVPSDAAVPAASTDTKAG